MSVPWHEHDCWYEEMLLNTGRYLPWPWLERELTVIGPWADRDFLYEQIHLNIDKYLPWPWPFVWTDTFKYRDVSSLTVTGPWAGREWTMSWPWLFYEQIYLNTGKYLPWPWFDHELTVSIPKPLVWRDSIQKQAKSIFLTLSWPIGYRYCESN